MIDTDSPPRLISEPGVSAQPVGTLEQTAKRLHPGQQANRMDLSDFRPRVRPAIRTRARDSFQPSGDGAGSGRNGGRVVCRDPMLRGQWARRPDRRGRGGIGWRLRGGAMGVARGRARGVSRREFLQQGLIGIGIISLGAACAPAPPAARGRTAHQRTGRRAANQRAGCCPPAERARRRAADDGREACSRAADDGSGGGEAEGLDHDGDRVGAGHDPAEGRHHRQRDVRDGQRLLGVDVPAVRPAGPAAKIVPQAGRELQPSSPTRRPGASSSARASSSTTASRSTPTRW